MKITGISVKVSALQDSTAVSYVSKKHLIPSVDVHSQAILLNAPVMFINMVI